MNDEEKIAFFVKELSELRTQQKETVKRLKSEHFESLHSILRSKNLIDSYIHSETKSEVLINVIAKLSTVSSQPYDVNESQK